MQGFQKLTRANANIPNFSKLVLFTLFTALIGVVGCGTKPKVSAPEISPRPIESAREGEENVDIVALKSQLGLDRSVEDLGYREKVYNTCEVGCGYSKVHNCRKLVFSVIHFQLSCRETEGTISTPLTARDIFPISNWKFKWMLPMGKGEAMTDPDGYGQLQLISQKSPKKERLKITVDNDFLYMRANEITKVVAPKDWCRPSRAAN